MGNGYAKVNPRGITKVNPRGIMHNSEHGEHGYVTSGRIHV